MRPWEDWFEQLQDWIGYLHLSDNEGRDDTHLPLGQGSVDWGLADALFRQMNRFAYVTVETNTLQDTEVSLAYLKEHHYFGSLGICYKITCTSCLSFHPIAQLKNQSHSPLCSMIFWSVPNENPT